MEALCFGGVTEVFFEIVVPAQLGSKDLIGAKGILNSEQGGEYVTCKK